MSLILFVRTVPRIHVQFATQRGRNDLTRSVTGHAAVIASAVSLFDLMRTSSLQRCPCVQDRDLAVRAGLAGGEADDGGNIKGGSSNRWGAIFCVGGEDGNGGGKLQSRMGYEYDTRSFTGEDV